MATVVMHVKTEKNYVLLGFGYGYWATDKPGMLGFSDRNEGAESVAYICDTAGEILKVHPKELVVVSVDGQELSTVLDPPPVSQEFS